jgi:nitroimidazol reductase NimA-like FMN-containing flavoprotein (pyridoxamine 5'-phosphate oxidase superfamily)
MLDPAGLEVLDTEECLRLLAQVPIGRVVFTDQALPAVLPVNFLINDGMIVLRTGAGSKLSAALRNAVVAFQADEFDAAARIGWSVTVIGQARLVRDGAELTKLSKLEFTPWAPGRRDHFVVISTEIVTGRRILPSDSTAQIRCAS